METLARRDATPRDVPATGPIIIATDGTRQSAGALAVGRAIAAALGAKARVVTAQPPLGLIVPDATLLLGRDALASLTEELRRRVREQVALVSAGDGEQLAEPIVENGEPERVISRLAEAIGAQMVVVGIGRHDVLDRIFGGETALKVAQRSPVPVLAVPEQSRVLPRSAVVAVDFSDQSFAAAQQVARLLPSGGALHLVHVVPRERLLLDPWLSDRDYERLVQRRFERVRGELSAATGVRIKDVIRSGNVARTLIACAEESGAELIAAGSHGHGFVARLILGSVTTALLRGARCMVLVVPPEPPVAGLPAADS